MINSMSPDAERAYRDAIQRMTPAQKIAVAEELWRTAWELKVAGVRMQHPEFGEEEVQRMVREIFLSAAS